MLTIPFADWTVPASLHPNIAYIKGQQEIGADTGYHHWQLLVVFKRAFRTRAVQELFGGRAHCELTRSDRADAYVWKEDTAVAGTRFELGSKPHRRNSQRDWDAIWEAAKTGDLLAVPAGVRVQHYRTLRLIASDHLEPAALERQIQVFWGATGLGKSRDAWAQLGLQAYPKDPRTKFWDGYQGQEHVVIDEFRGGIDIAHILRWCDRYPVRVEIKGASTVLRATRMIFTSNLHPKDWYPGLDDETLSALLRRLEIKHYVSL